MREAQEVGVDVAALQRVYSRQEAALLLGVSASTVGKLIRAGRLRAVRAGFGNLRQHVRITAEAIAEFLKGERHDDEQRR